MRSIVVAAGALLALVLSGVPAAAAAASAAVPAAQSAKASPEHPLSAVSCVSSRYCVAVGYNETADGGNGGPLAETWNGRAWTAETVKLPAATFGGALFGVSCRSRQSCLAVGEYFRQNDDTGALAEAWNGSTWTAAKPPVPAGATSVALSGISCVTSVDCVAVGSYVRDDTAVGLAETWNGHHWSDVPVKLAAGRVGGDLDGVSCTSPKSCVAVGSYGLPSADEIALAESWNGKSWTAVRPPAPTGNTSAALDGVSCTSPTNCIAVGWYTKANGSLGFAESWNGRKWTRFPMPKSGGYGGLYSVSCASPQYCLAVGDGGPAGASQGTPASDLWNGRSWSNQRVPVPPRGGGSSASSTLQGVKCLSTTDCVAVGELTLGNNEQNQYGFSGLWNGRTWKLTATV